MQSSRYQPIGLVTILFFSLFLAAASYVSDPVFNLYYDGVASLAGISDTLLAKKLIIHPELGHIICYGLLTFLSYFTFCRSILVSIFLPFSLGLLLELLQLFSPTRSPGLTDLLFNCLGIVVVVLLLWLFKFSGDHRR